MTDFFDGIEEAGRGRKWEYEEGDQLGGVVVNLFRSEGDFGPYTGYIISAVRGSTEGGKPITEGENITYFVTDTSSAARDLPYGRVKAGDTLRVKYMGEVPSKKAGHRARKDFRQDVIPTAPPVAADGQAADW